MECATVIVERSIYKWWKQTISTERLFTGVENAELYLASETLVLKVMGTRRDLAQWLKRLQTIGVGSGNQGQEWALGAQGLPDAGIRIWKFFLHNWPLSGTKKATDQRCFWLPLLCSAPESLLFNAVFLAYSFSSHLTLTEICFDYWEKGSKLKQVRGA